MNRVAQHPAQAFAVALMAVGVLSVMDAVMKGLVIALGIYALSVWRSLVGVILGTALYLPGRKAWPTAATLRIHLFRGAIITAMGLTFFWGLGRTPMAQAIALTFIAPLIALGLSAMFLGERIARSVIGGSLIAFAGVVLIMAGQMHAQLGRDALLGSLAILFSAVCYAVNIVLMRAQALAARPAEIGFFQNGTIAALMLLSLPFFGGVTWPAGHELMIVAASVMSTTGLLLFAFAYARGAASYLSVTEYSAFLWAAALGWLIFAEPLSPFTLAGAALIVAGSLAAARKGGEMDPELEAVA